MKLDETSKVRTEESTKTTFMGGNAELVRKMNDLKDAMSSFKSEFKDMKNTVAQVTTLLRQVVDSTGGISRLREIVSGDLWKPWYMQPGWGVVLLSRNSR